MHQVFQQSVDTAAMYTHPGSKAQSNSKARKTICENCSVYGGDVLLAHCYFFLQDQVQSQYGAIYLLAEKTVKGECR